ncbi:hypothetical protein E2C01_039564 [Portunus trituberculatus]|uniref:Uncharacterized protein n=1 Tax=Portunus trituberculatus TaxID=210409 RepID=A0A5B7FLN5_PORTR|nr:hypothetical protein [Portunus trituberculatus]
MHPMARVRDEGGRVMVRKILWREAICRRSLPSPRRLVCMRSDHTTDMYKRCQRTSCGNGAMGEHYKIAAATTVQPGAGNGSGGEQSRLKSSL